jgi:hypothetical protein
MRTTLVRRGAARPARRHALRPTPEALEGRQLLYATMGGQWALPNRISFSFVPDGTSVGGTPSSLFRVLNSDSKAPNWQNAIVQAAAAWQQVTGINLVQVADDGAALGTGPDQQGDPDHGDIRIAGAPANSSTLAFAFAPPPINGGDLAGDIVFNTAQPWTTNGGTYDLETVAIHELGHALGLDHSALTSAVLYAYYNGSKHALTADDTAGIQSLYGPQPGDPDANTSQKAINLNGSLSSQGQLTQVMAGPLLTQKTSGVDWFYVQAPANTSGTLTVSMQATGYSLLQPDVAVYNGTASTKLVEKYSTASGATVTATITGVSPGQGFYIRAGSAGYTPGRGAYALQVNFGSTTQATAVTASTTIADQPGQGGSTSSPDSTGDGGLGGLLGGLLQAVGGVLDHIVYGTLDGWGDSLTTRVGAHPSGPSRHFARVTPAVAPRHHQPPPPHHGPEGHARPLHD